MQSKSTFLEFLNGCYKFGPPPKNSSGANSSGANDVIAIDRVLCLAHVFPHVLTCLFVEFDLLRSSNYSSSGENQPTNENENEVRMQTVLEAKSALHESILVNRLLVCMMLLNAACSVVGMRDDAFLLHD